MIEKKDISEEFFGYSSHTKCRAYYTTQCYTKHFEVFDNKNVHALFQMVIIAKTSGGRGGGGGGGGGGNAQRPTAPKLAATKSPCLDRRYMA